MPLTDPSLLAPHAWRQLRARGADGDAALVHGSTTITYAALDGLVAARIRELGLTERSVVVLHGPTSLEHVVTYLALLAAGHVPLLAGEHHDQLTDAWRPAAVVDTTGATLGVRRLDNPQHALHPDLALLLSTSGSTGSPKLVRLSHRNLVANARSIATMLDLTRSDRGITSLPLHYCYGLSVLHSHLAAGASLVVVDASVVDPCFRAAMIDHGVTNLAGVPHTYELMERAGADRLAAPGLRLLTQAGGRMAPDDVRRWAARAAGWGAELVVMYGQTEATARIAYLPSHLAAQHPDSIGIAIPGTSVRLEPVDGQPEDVGELVVRGEHVMMGYAHTPDDLARGPEMQELRTGDLARQLPDHDILQIVGRRNRFVKPLGLRIDLDHVQRELGRRLADEHPGVELAVTGDDERLQIGVVAAPATEALQAAAALTGLPAGRVLVAELTHLPRTESGKVDFAAVCAAAVADDAHRRVAKGDDVFANAAALYREVLGVRDVGPSDTFVSLGGDSLSYVECSIRLESMLGSLPADWHVTPVGELRAPTRRRRVAQIDTTVALRALAICLVVGTHMGVFFFPGGAHTLLAVVGYNLARFMGSIDDPGRQRRAGLRTVRRVAAPTVAWIATGMAVFGAYSLGTLLLVNNYVGPSSHADDHWHFWFVEVFVHLVLLTTLLLSIPAVRRFERRRPYAVALAAFAISLLGRMDWAVIGDAYNHRFRTHAVAFYFFAGWLVARTTTRRQRWLTTAICLGVVPGFFGYSPRDWFIAGALAALVWLPEVPLARQLVTPVRMLASASMWILITHFTVWPVLVDRMPLPLAYVATIAAGVLVATLASQVAGTARDLHRSRHPQPQHGAHTCARAPLGV